MFLKIFSMILPWSLRRHFLNRFFKYEIDAGARIGMAWVFPGKLIMKKGAFIDHLTVAINLDLVEMGTDAIIGRSNWITGFPGNTSSLHFRHQQGKVSELRLGDQSAITKNHLIDATSPVIIGKFVTVAGYHSQLLTHSINLTDSRQDSAAIHIGDYCFIGTNCILLGGSNLPSYSVLGAKSLLNKSFDEQWMLYAGTPATPVKPIEPTARYFSREQGFVY